MKSSSPQPESQDPLASEAFQMGVTAAENSQNAATCPFPTGERRQRWLAGFFSAKSPLMKSPCLGPADACKSR